MFVYLRTYFVNILITGTYSVISFILSIKFVKAHVPASLAGPASFTWDEKGVWPTSIEALVTAHCIMWYNEINSREEVT